MTLVRRLRVLEYVGTAEWVDTCVRSRAIKGSFACGNGSIREAFVGEVNEILLDAEINAIEEARIKEGV